MRRRLPESTSWGGDSDLANDAARQLVRYADAPPATGKSARPQFQDICVLGLWRVARGDLAAGERAAQRLRSTRRPGLTGLDRCRSSSIANCAPRCLMPAVLSPWNRVMRGLVSPSPTRLRATYIFEVCCGEAVIDANLILARLWERLGDHPERVARRPAASGRFPPGAIVPVQLPARRGRLAALTGDTTGAVRAYRHYLALRPNPEPVAQAEVQRVEQALAALGARPMLARAP